MALGLLAAAQKAGLRLFFGSYPITPASDILHELARQRRFQVTTFQAEDEIAAIASAIGASFGGALGTTASSGPGIALKGESIGLAVMIELPLVIVDVQRGGPSTGLPTKTEQSDLFQAVYGRNGECPVPVLAARSPADCFESAYEAARVAVETRSPVILLGGMFSGLFTPTEAAAVACLYALFLGFVVYRTLSVKDMPAILINTAETTGIVAVLVMVAGALGWCMSISRIPQTVAPAIVAAIHEPLVFLFVSNLVLLAVGCFMEALAAMLILIPILVPAAISFGIDPVQFGLIMIFNLILGTIHPPIGVVLFVMARIAEVTFEQISRAILPWLVPLLIVLVAITVWPPLTLWLPGLVMSK